LVSKKKFENQKVLKKNSLKLRKSENPLSTPFLIKKVKSNFSHFLNLVSKKKFENQKVLKKIYENQKIL
jgi:hypothetical protein